MTTLPGKAGWLGRRPNLDALIISNEIPDLSMLPDLNFLQLFRKRNSHPANSDRHALAIDQRDDSHNAFD